MLRAIAALCFVLFASIASAEVEVTVCGKLSVDGGPVIRAEGASFYLETPSGTRKAFWEKQVSAADGKHVIVRDASIKTTRERVTVSKEFQVGSLGEVVFLSHSGRIKPDADGKFRIRLGTIVAELAFPGVDVDHEDALRKGATRWEGRLKKAGEGWQVEVTGTGK